MTGRRPGMSEELIWWCRVRSEVRGGVWLYFDNEAEALAAVERLGGAEVEYWTDGGWAGGWVEGVEDGCGTDTTLDVVGAHDHSIEVVEE
jgi:hypothetical protein